ncbi:MAG: hypothetical protein U5K75_04600 [Ahrensia sp.]|nr:hypothetical protein [Ahrensia sp.]
MQLLILLALFILIGLGRIEAVSREVGEPIFMVFGKLFVLLSPFGLLSAFMSAGVQLMTRYKLLFILPKNQMHVLFTSMWFKFFVWAEVRADLPRSDDENR